MKASFIARGLFYALNTQIKAVEDLLADQKLWKARFDSLSATTRRNWSPRPQPLFADGEDYRKDLVNLKKYWELAKTMDGKDPDGKVSITHEEHYKIFTEVVPKTFYSEELMQAITDAAEKDGVRTW